MAIIEVTNLKYRYPKTTELALKGITLSIEKGEFIGIIGQNGSGRTTLSQAFNGLVPQFYRGAYGGKVEVCGKSGRWDPVIELCEYVGLIFQNPFNQLSGAKDTVFAEVAFGLQNLGIEREEMIRRVEEVLKQLDIYQYKDRNPFDLSGGQMQRVAIASVLVMQPEIIILDEPTSQLDPQGSEEVFKVVDQLAQMGKTIIMIEQKLEKLAQYCDRIILMHDGNMIDFDTPEKIFSREDLEDYGIIPPAFTRIAKANALKNEDGTYPATLEGIQKLCKGKELIYPHNNEIYHTSNQENLFTVDHLDFYYKEGTPIFNQLDLLLDHRSTAIIGQNGAGKTTLVRLLKGLLKPVHGKIYFGKEDTSSKTVAMLASKVGYVFQNPDDQIFKYTVLEEVMFGPLNIGMTQEQAKKAAIEAINLMGLSGKEEMNPYDLELYDRKMVAIASVLAMDSDVIILDEPTIAQDYQGKAKIAHMIQELTKKDKLVIAILHDMDFVYENFERVIVMAHGKILCEGDVNTVFTKDVELDEAKLQKPSVLQIKELLMK